MDKIRFHPYYTYKDLVGFVGFILILVLFLFYNPNALGQGMACVGAVCGNSVEEGNSKDIRGEKFLLCEHKENRSSYPILEKSSRSEKGESAGNRGLTTRSPERIKSSFELRNAKVGRQKLHMESSGKEPQRHSGRKGEGSSETIRTTFDSWLAGLIDGDGSLLVSKEGYTSCEITLHEEDVKTLYKIKAALHGRVGKRTGARAYRWRMNRREGMVELIKRINGRILTKKRGEQLGRVCKVLGIEKKEGELKMEDGWLAGFIDAEGNIGVMNKNTLYLSIGQKEREILEEIREKWGCGRIYYDKAGEKYNFRIFKREDLRKAIGYFEKNKLRTVKNHEMVTFRRLLLFMERGYHRKGSGVEERMERIVKRFRERKRAKDQKKR